MPDAAAKRTTARTIVFENLKAFLSDPPDEMAETGRQMWIVDCLEHFAGCAVSEVRPLQRDGLGVRILQDDERRAALLESAKVHPIAYDACAELVLHACFHKLPLPEDLAWFIHHVMQGKAVRARRRGQAPSKNVWRNARIRMAIRHALHEDPSLHATRNETSAADSACDIVAECLQELGHNLTYKSVADIWRRRRW